MSAWGVTAGTGALGKTCRRSRRCTAVHRRERRKPRYTPAAFFSASALSVFSHENCGSSRPKWPCRAVSR